MSPSAITRRFHAAWVLPIVSPPLRDGWVTVRDGRVVDVGSGAPPAPAERVETVDLGRVALLPGLVNAHTHLELSWLWGKVPPADSLVEWVARLMAARRAADQDDPAAIASAILDMEEMGTAAVGDISNTLASLPAIAASRLDAVVFRELIGFNVPDPDALVAQAGTDARTRVTDALLLRGRGAGRSTDPDPATPSPPPSAFARERPDPPSGGPQPGVHPLRAALAPHAPYSVSPALFQAIAREGAAANTPSSVHLAESLAELRFLQSGDGPFRELLERVGAWNPSWTAPGCPPVEYLDRLGVLSSRLLVVHGVHLQNDELATLARHGATLVTCPRSNIWVGSGNPPVARFYASGVRVAVGTDSLASASDLNLFSELSLMHHLAPEIPPASLLASATRHGAQALALDDLGFIAPGARARLITIDLPVTLRDVETYLVEGIDPGQIAWAPANPADAQAAKAPPR